MKSSITQSALRRPGFRTSARNASLFNTFSLHSNRTNNSIDVSLLFCYSLPCLPTLSLELLPRTRGLLPLSVYSTNSVYTPLVPASHCSIFALPTPPSPRNTGHGSHNTGPFPIHLPAFQPLAHSFFQRRQLNSFLINHFRTLFMPTEGVPSPISQKLSPRTIRIGLRRAQHLQKMRP
jgi:hypothetical protein